MSLTRPFTRAALSCSLPVWRSTSCDHYNSGHAPCGPRPGAHTNLLNEKTNLLSVSARIPYHSVSMTRQSGQSPVTLALRDEFRFHLETFYSRLKLAPPYESVEKAIRALTTAVHSLPDTQQARLAQQPALKWEQFRRAFET